MTEEPETYAQIEVFGHRRHFGRISEVEKFGAKMLRIDVPTADESVFETLFYGGSSIFSITPCDEATARKGAEMLRPRPWNPVPRIYHEVPDDEPATVDDDDERPF